MSETRAGQIFGVLGKVRCELHPKQARYQASLQPDSQEQRLDFSTRVSARGSTSWDQSRGRQNALALPRRYQRNINLLINLLETLGKPFVNTF
jgi:hypothetical protein